MHRRADDPRQETPSQNTYYTGHRSDFYINLSVSEGAFPRVRAPYFTVNDPRGIRYTQAALNRDYNLHADVNGAVQRSRQAYETPMPSQLTTPGSGTGILMSQYKMKELGWAYNYTGQRKQSLVTATDINAAQLTSGHFPNAQSWLVR